MSRIRVHEVFVLIGCMNKDSWSGGAFISRNVARVMTHESGGKAVTMAAGRVQVVRTAR